MDLHIVSPPEFKTWVLEFCVCVSFCGAEWFSRFYSYSVFKSHPPHVKARWIWTFWLKKITAIQMDGRKRTAIAQSTEWQATGQITRIWEEHGDFSIPPHLERLYSCVMGTGGFSPGSKVAKMWSWPVTFRYEACPKSIRLYFFPEKPVMAGWQIWSQWWVEP
jgi:hypothetical protein